MQNGRPVAFESRSLNKSEEYYSPTDLEMLAIVHCCKKWRVYIEGRDVNVYTDHKPNITFDTVNMANRRHARWLDALQGHRLIWHYMKGVSNPADSLSRNPVPVCFVGVSLAGPLQFLGLVQAKPSPSAKLCDSLSFIEKVKIAYTADPWYASATNTASLTHKDGLYYNGTALALPANAELQTAAIAECHDTLYSGHVGRTKTLEIVRRFFWWPTGMAGAVRRYVKTCDSCQRNKGTNQRPGGYMLPLSVPTDTWQSVGMDLVTDLPTTATGHDAIVVFVDRLSKMVRLAPCRKDTSAEQFAQIFLDTVFKSHGFPSELVSDRGTIWTSNFWQAFIRLLGITSSMTSSFHPRSNGNTERVNRIMEDMLRHYIDAGQTNWVSLLPIVEFAINDSWHESVQAIPFELNYGRRPPLPMDGILRGEGRITTNCDSASERAEYILSAVKRAKAAMQAAQQRQKHVVDKRNRDSEFSLGDMVLLSTLNIKLKFKGASKLLPKWIGPFKVLDQVNPVAYKLKLPNTLKIHNVFHVSLLKAAMFRPGCPVNPPPPPELIDGEFEYEVESILSHRFTKNKLQYLVKWSGYGSEHNTWEPEDNCANCPDLRKQYWERIQAQADAAVASQSKASKARQTRKAKLKRHKASLGVNAGTTVLRRSKRARQ